MPSPNLSILYVEDPTASIPFYKALLGRDPLVASPNFAAFALDGGFTLGLWAAREADPGAPQRGNRTELAFMLEDDAAIQALYQAWRTCGVKIEREPYVADFGLTFVALDPDGHRIRVCPSDK